MTPSTRMSPRQIHELGKTAAEHNQSIDQWLVLKDQAPKEFVRLMCEVQDLIDARVDPTYTQMKLDYLRRHVFTAHISVQTAANRRWLWSVISEFEGDSTRATALLYPVPHASQDGVLV